ncbi:MULTISPECIES: hypothetical protein [Pandoraea]|uniref:Lipoprotein n=2 Tax=Pandoraea TaxID=93217 RepID=A0A5E4XE50_9BURK|nr:MULTISPECIES: hypothetical protein [Pandoraea]VVE16593.1 hypothetical protein PCE31107_02927 [Pandoraea cepalis]VVE34440.1 hypothetical protein PTE31013_03848 [Pandoraea terrigena]
MKYSFLAAVTLAGLAVLSSARAGQRDDEEVYRQRVIDYVVQQYGNGTPLAAAAMTYARTAGELWLATAQTQQYDQGMTQRAGIAEICFRGQLAEAGVSDLDGAVAALERTIASNPAIYAGELYAAALALQHPLDLAMTPTQACLQARVPLP